VGPKLITVLVPLALLALLGAGRLEGTAPVSTVTLHFTDDAGIAEDCSATRGVERLLGTAAAEPLETRLDAALQLLFAGVSDDERSVGLSDPYGLLFMEPEPLPAYYRGVTVSAGVAVVDFAPPGLTYLNSEACRQAVLKMPIVRTLLGFDGVDRVEFSIEGEIVTEFDA
jgi:hypothetical protein